MAARLGAKTGDWFFSIAYLCWGFVIMAVAFVGWQQLKSWILRFLALDVCWALILIPMFYMSATMGDQKPQEQVPLMLLFTQTLIIPYLLLMMLVMGLIDRKFNLTSFN